MTTVLTSQAIIPRWQVPPVHGVLKAMLVGALEIIFVSPNLPIPVKLVLIKMMPCEAVRTQCNQNGPLLTLDIWMDKWLIVVVQSGSDIV